MRTLDRKLIRDLWLMKGQVLAIALVMACGVATFVMSLSTLSSLERTKDAYYERYRFAEVFAHLKRAPDSVASRIREIPGVAQVQTRVVAHVTLEVPGLSDPALGRLVSIPPGRHPSLNERYLRTGRHPEPGRDGEVLVSEGFAHANKLQPGDSIWAVLNGRKQRLEMVGIALSPEYIYQIRPGDILPDDRRFGVFWMPHTALAAAFDMQGAFNDVCLTLSPGASEEEVIRRLDQLLGPYGGLGAHGRADQPSHKFVSNELKELRGMASVVPTIFLAVASFLLHVVTSRLIQTQREQIAALKAFGYSGREVAWHYLKFVLLIVLVGVILGTLIGARLGRAVTELYTRFFHFPVFAFRLDGGVVLRAVLFSGGASILGALTAIRGAARLPPAEAMRPETPARYRPTLLERLGLRPLLSPAVLMILRNLERAPLRAGLSILGIALAVSVLIIGSFSVDALDYVMESQFVFAQRQELSVALVEPTSSAVLSELQALPGVRTCEPFRAIAARLRHEHRSRRLGVMGLPPDSRLYRVMDIDRNLIRLPPEGIVLSAKLAQVLGVSVGDSVTLEVLEGRRQVRQVRVAGLLSDFAGIAAYMDIAAVNRLVEEGSNVTGAFLSADSKFIDKLYRKLQNTPRIASVTIKGTALVSFRKTIAENLLWMRLFNVGFACVIAFGVVYNTARITLAERRHELATLRVLGFGRREVSLILLGELAAITLVAVPLGLVLGRVLAGMVITIAYDTELFRIPLVIGRSTFAFAALVTLSAALVSALTVVLSIKNLDLVSVLKGKE